jgi:hypothetical protein
MITTKYFPACKVSPFVALLASDECPISGEFFAVGAGRAARVTLHTYPGSIQSTAEDFLQAFPRVMVTNDEIYIPQSTGDDAVYIIKQVTGDDLSELKDFGNPINLESKK